MFFYECGNHSEPEPGVKTRFVRSSPGLQQQGNNTVHNPAQLSNTLIWRSILLRALFNCAFGKMVTSSPTGVTRARRGRWPRATLTSP